MNQVGGSWVRGNSKIIQVIGIFLIGKLDVGLGHIRSWRWLGMSMVSQIGRTLQVAGANYLDLRQRARVLTFWPSIHGQSRFVVKDMWKSEGKWIRLHKYIQLWGWLSHKQTSKRSAQPCKQEACRGLQLAVTLASQPWGRTACPPLAEIMDDPQAMTAWWWPSRCGR